MRSFILSLAIVMIKLAIAAPGVEAISFTKRAEGFSSTCTDMVYNSDTGNIFGQCKNEVGGYVGASIYLNNCLANGAGGYLVCETG